MYSSLFCGTLETSIKDYNRIKADNRGIKLYKIELLEYQALVSGLVTFLSSSERQRAKAYHFTKDRNRFIICRAFLKLLLAELIDLDVTKIVLDIDSNKKPYLPSHPSVFFNVSHAGDYGLITIAKHPVGIDIEYINKKFDCKEILQNVFNQNEIDTIENSSDKHHTFYKFWTRKEAIVKAIGKGIDDGLKEIPISDGLHSVPSALIYDFKNINVFSFNVNNDYVGSLALTNYTPNFENIVFYPLPTFE